MIRKQECKLRFLTYRWDLFYVKREELDPGFVSKRSVEEDQRLYRSLPIRPPKNANIDFFCRTMSPLLANVRLCFLYAPEHANESDVKYNPTKVSNKTTAIQNDNTMLYRTISSFHLASFQV